MKTNSRYPQEFTIDPVALFNQICTNWKKILLLGIMVAVIISGGKYIKDTNNYKTAKQTEAAKESVEVVDAAEQISGILSNLSDSDRMAVEQTLRLKESIIEKNDYMRDSILMNLDPYSVKTLTLGFVLSDVEDTSKIGALSKGYYSVFDDTENIEKVRSIIDLNVDLKYITELITIFDNEKEDGAIQVSIFIPDDVDESELAMSVKEIMDARCKELSSSVTPHSLKTMYNETIKDNNGNLNKLKTDNIQLLYSLQMALQTTEKLLTEPQVAAYNTISAIHSKEKAIKEPVALEKPGISKKYLLAGFVLGAMLYIAYLALSAMLNTKIISASYAEHLTKSRLVGHIRYGSADRCESYTSKAFSRRLSKYEETDKQCYKTTKTLDAIISHFGFSKIEMLDFTHNDENETGLIEQIINSANKDGVILNHIKVEDDYKEDELARMGNVLLVIDNATKADIVAEIVENCKYYDINVIGTIYLEKM